ncbi:3-oxo-5-alpha-steroid 4-dehydrogenase 2 isoform X2 [Ascaphus truei]|uniref:3-oxo-5-alpha-steroid 4-dehydrogenase 2 isoform X2 n=1 Tax=Ascaphus truei TaxID=8439 RepID=UPI003F59C337
MQCNQDLDFYMSFFLGAMGLVFFVRQMTAPATYGRHVSCNNKKASIMVPAKYGWFIQELPSFLVPLLVILYSQHCNSPGCMMLFFMFCGHYFHRTFIYSTFTRGRPSPLPIVIMAVLFCTFNGFLQGHCMVYVAAYPQEWYMDSRFASGGLFDYVSGANFLGEIVEWFGYAVATWSMPAFAFAFFTLCSIGPRAYHHHRYYLQMFKDYPRGRKALIPFIF